MRRSSSLNSIVWRTAGRLIRPIPRWAGRVRVARWLRPRLPGGTGLRLATTTRTGVRLVLDVDHWLQAETMLTGDWDPDMCALIADALPNGGVFFDVGANVGLASLCVHSRTQDKRLATHAFEPAPANVEAFRRNLELNPTFHVSVNAVAVGAKLGRARLTLANEPTHHYVADVDAGPRTIEVPLITLDDYVAEHRLDHVDVIKLDVEGSELEVIKGARELLSNGRVGVIVCELIDAHLQRNDASSARVTRQLMEWGYVPHVLLPMSRRIRQVVACEFPALEGDVAFVRL